MRHRPPLDGGLRLTPHVYFSDSAIGNPVALSLYRLYNRMRSIRPAQAYSCPRHWRCDVLIEVDHCALLDPAGAVLQADRTTYQGVLPEPHNRPHLRAGALVQVGPPPLDAEGRVAG